MSEEVAVYDPQTRVVRSEVVRPLVSPEEGKADWDKYIGLCNAILVDADYQTISGKRFKKKSAWRKLSKAFAVSDRILAQTIERNERGWPLFAAFTVEAESPTGQTAVGYHEAHVGEKCCPGAFGRICPKTKYEDHTCCPAGCDGWHTWSHPGDVPATAHTRAKNRAIADLIGAGEVSAEEMEGTTEPPPRQQRTSPPPTRTRQSVGPSALPSQRAFWTTAKKLPRCQGEDGNLSKILVHRVLGFEEREGAIREYVDARVATGFPEHAVWDDLRYKLEHGLPGGARIIPTDEEVRQEEGAEAASELPFD